MKKQFSVLFVLTSIVALSGCSEDKGNGGARKARLAVSETCSAAQDIQDKIDDDSFQVISAREFAAWIRAQPTALWVESGLIQSSNMVFISKDGKFSMSEGSTAEGVYNSNSPENSSMNVSCAYSQYNTGGAEYGTRTVSTLHLGENMRLSDGTITPVVKLEAMAGGDIAVGNEASLTYRTKRETSVEENSQKMLKALQTSEAAFEQYINDAIRDDSAEGAKVGFVFLRSVQTGALAISADYNGQDITDEVGTYSAIVKILMVFEAK